MTITLRGKPISTNHVWKHACRGQRMMSYLTDEGRAAKESYQWQARSQYHHAPLVGRLSITVELYFADARRHDWDNYHKLSCDALNGIVWVDDSQIVEASVSLHIDRNDPRIVLHIKDAA